MKVLTALAWMIYVSCPPSGPQTATPQKPASDLHSLVSARTFEFAARVYYRTDNSQNKDGFEIGEVFLARAQRPASLSAVELLDLPASGTQRPLSHSFFSTFASDGKYILEQVHRMNPPMYRLLAWNKPLADTVKAVPGEQRKMIPQLLAADILFSTEPLKGWEPAGEGYSQSTYTRIYRKRLQNDRAGTEWRLMVGKESGLPIQFDESIRSADGSWKPTLRVEFAEWRLSVPLPKGIFDTTIPNPGRQVAPF